MFSFCCMCTFGVYVARIVYVCLYSSGKEEQPWPITGGEMINQSCIDATCNLSDCNFTISNTKLNITVFFTTSYLMTQILL